MITNPVWIGVETPPKSAIAALVSVIGLTMATVHLLLVRVDGHLVILRRVLMEDAVAV